MLTNESKNAFTKESKKGFTKGFKVFAKEPRRASTRDPRLWPKNQEDLQSKQERSKQALGHFPPFLLDALLLLLEDILGFIGQGLGSSLVKALDPMVKAFLDSLAFLVPWSRPWIP